MKIPSFTINHLSLSPGLYVSRRDGDVTTFDLRIRRPYADPVLTNAEMHSLEHLLATELRSGALKKHVLYVGPMGCATGLYVLYRDLCDSAVVQDLIRAFKAIQTAQAMPGNSRQECGNCDTLDLEAGKRVAKQYYGVIADKTRPDGYAE